MESTKQIISHFDEKASSLLWMFLGLVITCAVVSSTFIISSYTFEYFQKNDFEKKYRNNIITKVKSNEVTIKNSEAVLKHNYNFINDRSGKNILTKSFKNNLKKFLQNVMDLTSDTQYEFESYTVNSYDYIATVSAQEKPVNDSIIKFGHSTQLASKIMYSRDKHCNKSKEYGCVSNNLKNIVWLFYQHFSLIGDDEIEPIYSNEREFYNAFSKKLGLENTELEHVIKPIKAYIYAYGRIGESTDIFNYPARVVTKKNIKNIDTLNKFWWRSHDYSKNMSANKINLNGEYSCFITLPYRDVEPSSILVRTLVCDLVIAEVKDPNAIYRLGIDFYLDTKNITSIDFNRLVKEVEKIKFINFKGLFDVDGLSISSLLFGLISTIIFLWLIIKIKKSEEFIYILPKYLRDVQYNGMLNLKFFTLTFGKAKTGVNDEFEDVIDNSYVQSVLAICLKIKVLNIVGLKFKVPYDLKIYDLNVSFNSFQFSFEINAKKNNTSIPVRIA